MTSDLARPMAACAAAACASAAPTAAFAAALAVSAPGEFHVEYAGEIALAKRYGSYRI